ncbi:hypothetical protein XENTR_v10013255 [Xenopus tropicalis]|uniref:Mitochondrial amidoxime-reducing component 1 n=1 Tax=Xenopus tropicalis TaxID=8364 RepID=A0A6I8SPQ4_XENTR|nr:mitochondrial amidoxime-reducing component 1 isoform X1 [Xenopus tropicalis]KAE8600451.1 hypothetical protein XENTR_v10013255 [Xenopus tropicalis]KAE8600452.1 hypothetical protein XENTR_v10013255 [Xenopus tropicalis]|eukprot:XP_002936061.1 PREDICTED: mitochondrial amidoxime-reducing component 1 [Xenopus tropicalis]
MFTMEAIVRHRMLLMSVAGAGAAIGFTWLVLSLRKKKRKLRKVGEVTQLIVYPIKSCKGVPLPEAECSVHGLRNGLLRDRHWAVSNEEKTVVSARHEPRLVLINSSSDQGFLTLSAPEMEDLKVPLTHPSTNEVVTSRVLGHLVQGRDCGDEASHWITAALRSRHVYRLLQFEDRMKHRNPKDEYVLYTENDKVAYPELSPLHVLSEAAVEDLNSRLEEKVTFRNFRPNILISGCGAYEEDSWEEIQIGRDVTLKRVMPSIRCLFTTVDPDTGIPHAKNEPLKTLRSYRLCQTELKKLFKSSPLFGQYFRVTKKGDLKVGDPVYQVVY